MVEAFPLQWPAGYERTKYPQRSRFQHASFDGARSGVTYELQRLKATNVVFSTNLPVRKDGFPYASAAPPQDKGIAVYFVLDGQQMVLACDRWDRIADNMCAIELTIEAMRSLDRWGVSDMLKRSFTGFKALPEQQKRSCWDVLGINPTTDQTTINTVYRRKAKEAHPDMQNGSHHAFTELQDAFKEAITYAEGRKVG